MSRVGSRTVLTETQGEVPWGLPTFVVTFQYKSDAVWFYEHLKHRMGHFGLSLEEEK